MKESPARQVHLADLHVAQRERIASDTFYMPPGALWEIRRGGGALSLSSPVNTNFVRVHFAVGGTPAAKSLILK